jgi:hypothetical protein
MPKDITFLAAAVEEDDEQVDTAYMAGSFSLL